MAEENKSSPVEAVKTMHDRPAPSDEELQSKGVNPASIEADEIRQTGTQPLDKKPDDAGDKTTAPEKEEDRKKTEQTTNDNTHNEGLSQHKNITEILGKKDEEKGVVDKNVASGEEAAGILGMAVERVTEIAQNATEATAAFASDKAEEAKEGFRVHAAATVIDAEKLYEASKLKAAQMTTNLQNKAFEIADKVTTATGQVLENAGEKLIAVAKQRPSEGADSDGPEQKKQEAGAGETQHAP